ncbi:MAG: glycosyltransferase family 4 protein [Gemmatimonadaceae bacterium]|nr:glycosyltransferase family 4 protein [Gemmatimonadaceae bacterium]NUQ92162.1 glycosyltransferase family 4 protein [Gemmatimonadaceae bacterium]NUR20943.1 glycosyltransferase family 4 protein [Gemmatimonadaceae bacterium]NUS97082.1 glycosyltransferase family 4 protein [Gemmatimonadaceae bacterium]
MSALRIALLNETGGPGGAEHMLLDLAEGLRARGHEVIPIGPDDRNPWLGEQFRARGFAPETYSMRGLADLRCLRGIATMLRRRGAQIAHSHEFTMGVYGAGAARIARIPHVLTMHGGRYYAGKLQRRIALGIAARLTGAVVGVSSSAARELERTLRLRPGRARVVPNGVPERRGDGERVRRELGLGAGERLVVAVGNLYPVKGHIVLLRALASLSGEERARTIVAIAGRGEEEARLLAFARERGIADRVRLLGYRSDAADVVTAADVYAMPSLSEGLPLALLEAMMAGRAVVASSVGGIPEAARDGEHALLVPPGDEDALAAALRRLLGDAGLRERLGRAARARALEEHGIARMLDAYEQIYSELVTR